MYLYICIYFNCRHYFFLLSNLSQILDVAFLLPASIVPWVCMFYPSIQRFYTFSLKIDKNHCKQKYKPIQAMGVLYRYISHTAFTCNNIFTVVYLFL